MQFCGHTGRQFPQPIQASVMKKPTLFSRAPPKVKVETVIITVHHVDGGGNRKVIIIKTVLPMNCQRWPNGTQNYIPGNLIC